MDFQKELEILINKCSKANESNIPDFILAQYLNDCLLVFSRTVKARDQWSRGNQVSSQGAPAKAQASSEL